MRKLMIAVLGALFALPVVASEVTLCAYDYRPQTIVYSNGVGNDYFTAEQSALETIELIRRQHQSAPAGGASFEGLVDVSTYLLLHHSNNGASRDVAEVILQKAVQEGAQASTTWSDLITQADVSTGNYSSGGSIFSRSWFGFISDELRYKSAQQVRDETREDTRKLKTELLSNPQSRLIIIGHSQGSLYANEILKQLELEFSSGLLPDGSPIDERVQVINVGAAADSVAGFDNPFEPYQYVTSSSDKIINGLRILSAATGLQEPLRANTESEFNSAASKNYLDATDYLLNHGYLTTYLPDTTSSRTFQKVLKNVLLQVHRVKEVKQGSRVQVEVDVSSQYESSCDSTCVQAPSPFEIKRPVYFEVASRAVKAGRHIYSYEFGLNCSTIATTLNLRTDIYSIDTRSAATEIHGTTSSFIKGFPNFPPTLHSARARVLDANGAGQWIPIDVSRGIIDNGRLSLKLFDYSQKMDAGGIRMRVMF